MSKLKKALELAKKARNTNDKNIYKEKSQPPVNLEKNDEIEQYSQELNITYSKTKVLDIDPRKLKKNKIYSHIGTDWMSEQINILRTQVLNKLESINGNTVMVTSAHPGEGKTFISINLAFSIAQELGRTVLLVDCDLRPPESSHFDFATDYFGVKIEKGLSDVLLMQNELSEVFLNPGIERLTIVPGGRPVLNSSELLGSRRMENLVKEMKDRYGKNRIIIFDSPSILKISDPLAFSRFVDGVLLVVESKRTSNSDIIKVIELLKDRVILGTILNKVD